jgi:ubiquinone biosynthesis accessory factor UbiJ
MSSVADSRVERLLERAVAQARADSPRTVALLAALQGRRLSVRIEGTPWSYVVESTGLTLRSVRDTNEAAPDASISGAPLSLLALAGTDPQAVIARGDVTIAGDAEIAQQFRELGMLLRPDLEAGMSHLLGRSGAHIAMMALRSAHAWTRSTAWTATQNVAEYLAHERGDLVSRSEAEHFLRDVDRLREQVDRLEARLLQLERESPT